MKMAHEKVIRPTDGELEILNVLWDDGDSSVRDIWTVLNRASPLDRTSVAKRVDTMVEKKLLSVCDDRRPARYRAAIDRKTTYESYARDLTQRFFGNDPVQLAMHIAKLKKPLSETERQRILDQIDKMK